MQRRMKSRSLFIFCFFCSFLARAFDFPPDSVKNAKQRKLVVAISAGAAAGGSLVYLNQAWYKPYGTGSFHFFDDNGEWLQMDKAGHVFTTYQAGRAMLGCMRWAGFSQKQSLWLGGGAGFLYLSAIEVMDGFSKGWGFSWGDMGANTAGALLAIGQEAAWHGQRISLKFSFHQTSFPQYRPVLLGKDPAEQVLKDYNGQTYWLSANIASFFCRHRKFPRWLNLAIGYGASGMISGDNNYVYVGADGKVIGNDRYRRYYLSLDADLTRIKTKSKFLKAVFAAVNCIKIPFPAIEWSQSELQAHPFFF
jgi:hypothetical protein